MERQIKNNGKSYKLQYAIDEANIRRQVEKLVKSVSNMDTEGVTAIYAPDIVSFDVEGTYLGAEEKKGAWTNLFSMIEPPLEYEIRDLAITIDENVAFSHSHNRLSGKLKSGQHISSWVRYTACYRKIEGSWLIVHEQVSVPADIVSGRALPDPEPRSTQ